MFAGGNKKRSTIDKEDAASPKKLATRLKMHFRAMMIHSPRIKNLYSY